MPRYVKQKTGQPIGRTLLTNIAAIGVASVLLLSLVLTVIIKVGFDVLEDDEVATQQARLDTFMKDELKEIRARAKDWALWDETYFYTLDFNENYRRGNINATSFGNLLIDGLLVYRYADSEFRSYAFDSKTGQPRHALARGLESFAATPDFAARLAARGDYQGFVALDGTIYALSAYKITRSDGLGASPGYMVMVSEMDSRGASAVLQTPAMIVADQTQRDPAVVKTRDAMTILTPFADGDGRPVGHLEVRLPRPLIGAAQNLILLAVAGTVAVLVSVLIVLQLRVKSLVLTPVEAFHSHLNAVRESGDLAPIEGPLRDDELGAVQGEYNRMVSEMQELRAQLDSQSFALGKSQSAIGLIHNLRNCLAPVRVILDLLQAQVNRPLPPQTGRALAELQVSETDPARREKLVQFLLAAHDDMAARDADNLHSVREAARNLMNAFEAIDDVQNAKGQTDVDEKCDLPRALSHAGNIARFSPDCAIAIEIEAQPGVIAKGNRVLISQVVENLVMNAVESIRHTGRTDGAITLRAQLDETSEECRIMVIDNGEGFDAARAAKLFERGFSTRTEKSGGLGLHWCANTIKAIGGELTLTSPGPGEGAVARITLKRWREISTQHRAAA